METHGFELKLVPTTTNDGEFREYNKKIGQFPEKRFFSEFRYDPKIVTDTTRFWIKAQEKINEDNQLRFFKTIMFLEIE